MRCLLGLFFVLFCLGFGFCFVFWGGVGEGGVGLFSCNDQTYLSRALEIPCYPPVFLSTYSALCAQLPQLHVIVKCFFLALPLKWQLPGTKWTHKIMKHFRCVRYFSTLYLFIMILKILSAFNCQSCQISAPSSIREAIDTSQEQALGFLFSFCSQKQL